MGLKDLGPDSPGIIATQSAHKQLASFSQASQIHTKDGHIRGQERRVEHRRMNESFLLHASTSPFYPIFASLDVGAQMMKGRSGQVLWDDTVRLGIELRKKIRAIAPRVRGEGAGAAASAGSSSPSCPTIVPMPATDGRARRRRALGGACRPTTSPPIPRFWALAPRRRAGTASATSRPGFAITDPNKLTILTPGFDRRDGRLCRRPGSPRPVVAQYLRENRIVPEKNDLNSLLFLLTPGVESSKAGTLISALVAFKRLHDEDAPVEEVMPDFVRRRRASATAACASRRSAATSTTSTAQHGTSRLQRAMFAPEHLPEMAVAPHEAVRALVRNRVDYVPIEEAEGRIVTTLMLVYPPGIGVLVPGERIGPRAKPMLDYFKMFEEGSNRFPGLDAEIQGVYRETEPDGRIRFYTYVMREGARGSGRAGPAAGSSDGRS